MGGDVVVLSILGSGLAVLVMVLLMVFLTAIPLLLLWRVLARSLEQRKERLHIMSTGVAGTAQVKARLILASTQKVFRLGGAQVELTLEVQAGEGVKAPYAVTIRRLLPLLALPQLEKGTTIPIRIDPQDAQRVTVDLLALGFEDLEQHLFISSE